MKFHYIRRDDGSVIDVPEHHVWETLKRNPLWEDLGEVQPLSPELQEAPVKKEEPAGFFCPLCGFEAKTESGLRLHKIGKHK